MPIDREISESLNFNFEHSLYSQTGTWYQNLTRFPGVLYDQNGYVSFQTENDYRNNRYLSINVETNVPEGVSVIPGYIRFSASEKNRIVNII